MLSQNRPEGQQSRPFWEDPIGLGDCESAHDRSWSDMAGHGPSGEAMSVWDHTDRECKRTASVRGQPHHKGGVIRVRRRWDGSVDQYEGRHEGFAAGVA